MITEIGITAGDIWHYLEGRREATFDEIVQSIGRGRGLVLMSLGWLAREGHVSLRDENGVYRVSLNSK